MSRLTPNQIDLLRETHLAFIATINKDGSPQVTPVWVDTDGTNLLINTSRGRLKELNMRRDPRVSVVVVDPKDPHGRNVLVQGRVRLEEEGAIEHIDSLAKKYTGADRYPWLQPGEVRVKVTVEPRKSRLD